MLRPSLKSSVSKIGLVRSVTTKSDARVLAPFTSADQIKKFINTPTWNIYEDLIVKSKENTTTDIDISTELLEKLLKMSGLQMNNELEIRDKLKEQLLFLNKLHSAEVHDTVEKIQEKALSLEDIIDSVKIQRKDTSKGEQGDWNPTNLASVSKNDFYIVREGLIKK